MKCTVAMVTLLLCSMIPASLQWGSEGHQIVAQIAQDRLNANTNGLLSQFIGSKTLADIAPGPDSYDHTPAGKWSGPCHYVNLPRGATGFDWSDCGTCCVVGAVQNYTTILTKEASGNISPCDFEAGVAPCALEFLVHYVGDIHQPLHCGYGDDRGGNEVKASYFGKTTNLHTVWDTSIITMWNSDVSSAVQALEKIIQQEPSQVNQYLSVMDSVSWADESFGFVQSTVYNYTSSNGVAQIDQEYYNTNLPIIQQRLIAAGVRLAALLEAALTPSF